MRHWKPEWYNSLEWDAETKNDMTYFLGKKELLITFSSLDEAQQVLLSFI